MSPPVHPHVPRVAVACGCALGEEVLWDARDGGLIWVDIENPAIWRHWPAHGETVRVAVEEKLGFAALTPDPDVVLAGFVSGVARLNLRDGTRTPVVRPEPQRAGNRLNSGVIGADGALWFSDMDDAEEDPTGRFHRFDGDRLHSFGDLTAVTNGPVMSPDGRLVYTVDTAGGVISRHERVDGRIGAPVPLIDFPDDWGHPDGLTLDEQGHLWICHYGGSRVTRFTPAGEIERVLPVPTDLVTKCGFGGPDLSTLYITTALRGRDPAEHPAAGHLFVVETEVRGFAGQIFGRPELRQRPSPAK